MTTLTKLEPTPPTERVEVIDILRGFAIFGILLVNMLYFAQPVYREVLELAPWANPLDRAAEWVISFFGVGKFFTLFSFLFGLGLALQMQRTAGTPFVARYARRLVVLLGFGLVHAFLFWWGDILIYYALLGALLLLFRNSAPRKLLVWAVSLLVVAFLFNAALVGLMTLARSTPEGAAQMQAMMQESNAQYQMAYEEALRVYRGDSFRAMIPQRIADWAFATFGVFLNGMFFSIFSMFLLGLYAGKRQLLHRAQEHLPLFRRVFLWGGLIGISGNLLYTLVPQNPLEPTLSGLWGVLGYLFGAPALSMTYASGLVLLTQNPRWYARLQPLAAVGRMALSNYLLQTLVCTTLFYGYGFGFYGQLSPAMAIVLTFLIFALQIPLSNWWVKHFRFGLFEWLWRSLSYGKLQPLRLPAPHSAQGMGTNATPPQHQVSGAD